MRTILALSILVVVTVLSTGGCASNPIVGDAVSRTDYFYGDVGITGHNGNIRILSGSHVTKLSIIGNGNTINVDDDVTLPRVEFWGKGNTVIIPENLMIARTTQVGANSIVRRPTTRPQLPPLGETATTTILPPEEGPQTVPPVTPPQDESRVLPPPGRSQAPEEADGVPSDDEK